MTPAANPAPLMAPPLQVSRWFNTDEPITLEGLQGKVVVIEAFQMLCPGCVLHGLPQAAAIASTFSTEQVAVLGLHSVFEHHAAMQPHALEVFLHEYRIGFPVAVDAPAEPGTGMIPRTMRSYSLRGTPSLLLIDRAGRLRWQHFGKVSDMLVAAEISELVFESSGDSRLPAEGAESLEGEACAPEGCK